VFTTKRNHGWIKSKEALLLTEADRKETRLLDEIVLVTQSTSGGEVSNPSSLAVCLDIAFAIVLQ